MMIDLFIPFTKNRTFWQKGMKIILLNKFYEFGIDDKSDIQYDTLLTSYSFGNDERYKLFVEKLIQALGTILNQYHGLCEKDFFWEKILYFWIEYFTCSIQFKIEQLNNLQKHYPKERYCYYTVADSFWEESDLLSDDDGLVGPLFSERYNFVSYLWLAKRYFGFNIREFQEKDGEAPIYSKPRITIRDIYYFLYEKTLWFLGIIAPCPMRIGLLGEEHNRWSELKWMFWSAGAIRKLQMAQPRARTMLDKRFRNSLKAKIMEQFETNTEEEMILDILPIVFPRFFVEDFKNLYDVANHYLDMHPHLCVIHTTSAYVSHTVQNLCRLLLQKRGGKILGQQHGGAYQISEFCGDMITRDSRVNDVFYRWGKGEQDCKPLNRGFSYAPSYKLSQYDDMKIERESKYILFAGIGIGEYPAPIHFGNVDAEWTEYIKRKIRFFSSLEKDVRNMMVVREFPYGNGWPVAEQLQRVFPDLKTDLIQPFAKLLAASSLFVTDHTVTVWLEALYLNKPMIIFMPNASSAVLEFKLIKSEVPYFKMLEEVGVLVHSPEEAAVVVNQITKSGIMKWWLEEKRQRIIELLRQRWTTRVTDIDDWWYHELMAQAETTKCTESNSIR